MRSVCLAVVIWAMCIAAPAIGEVLIVQDASFEDVVLPAGEQTGNGVGLEHWTVEPGLEVGVWNVSNLLNFPGGAPDGVNVAYSDGPTISQALPDVIIEGMTYTLTVKVGNAPCCTFPGYAVQLVANNVILAEDANYIPVPSGTFETVVVSYTSPPGDANAGQPLEIRLQSLGQEAVFDAVNLTATKDAFPDWKLVDADGAVSRGGANMVYDAARGVAVMFGGWDTGPLADTWELDGSFWSLIDTADSPSARVWYSMVYDSNRQRIVLFGGLDPDNTIVFNDTWEYDGTNWEQINTLHSPPEMQVRTMAFDSGRNRTVLFGGDGQGISFDDTWEYDGSDWTQIVTPTSPPAPGSLAAMTYDAARERTVLTFYNHTLHLATWEYDGSNWKEVITVMSPFGRWAHTTIFDDSSKRVVLFGGIAPDYASDSAMNDTWEYDGSDWTQIVVPHSPGPADQHAMTFDTATGRAVVLNWGQTWVYTSPELFRSNFEGIGNSEVRAPIIISSNPVSPADDNHPEIIGSVGAGTNVDLFSDSGCSEPLASGTADEFNTTGITIDVTDDSVTNVYASAMNDASTFSPCSSTFITYIEGDCDIGSGTWAAEARDCTSEDCSDGRWYSWDGRIWCRAMITLEHENWDVTVPPGTTTFDFWADWGAWDFNDCGDGVTHISIPVCGLHETIYRDGVERRLSCDVTGQSSFVIEKEAVACEYVIIGNPNFY